MRIGNPFCFSGFPRGAEFTFELDSEACWRACPRRRRGMNPVVIARRDVVSTRQSRSWVERTGLLQPFTGLRNEASIFNFYRRFKIKRNLDHNPSTDGDGKNAPAAEPENGVSQW